MSFLKSIFTKQMSEEKQEKIAQALKRVKVPFVEKSLDALGALKEAKGTLHLSLVLPFPAKSLIPELEKALMDQLSDTFEAVQFEWAFEVVTHQVQSGVKPLKSVKNIIAVGSGKGGVGKSTTAVNLALALAQEGGKVGILDADIYGPSIPTMLNLHEKPTSPDGQHMQPLRAYGVEAMSIGFLIEEDTPMIWRGPLITQTLVQLLNKTLWGDLDYLIIDLPPGTGDVQLTLAQQIPVTGAVVVTTPQQVALVDARKALAMFEKVKIPVMGLVENMSTHICSCCGCEEPIFGEGGGEALAQEKQVPLLAKMLLDATICRDADKGEPTVVAEPESLAAKRYHEIALKVAAQLAQKKKEYSQLFPEIVVK